MVTAPAWLAKPEHQFFKTGFRHALVTSDLPHDLVKYGVTQRFPGRQNSTLQLCGLFKQLRIGQATRSSVQSPPSFSRSCALAGQITGLPNHINRADQSHHEARYGDESRAIGLGNDYAKGRRAAEYLQEAKGCGGSTVKPSQSLPIFASESSLQDQVISIRIYPHLICHCWILGFLHQFGFQLWKAALPELALTNFLATTLMCAAEEQGWAELLV